MNKYNFTHLFLNNSAGYNKETQLFIEKLRFKYKQLFVYRYLENAPKTNRNNVIVDKEICSINKVKEYLKISDFVFLHALNYSRKEILKLNDEECKKIIWCVWGHDLYEVDIHHNNLYLILRKIYRILKHREYEKKQVAAKISKFRAIVIGFEGDRYTIRNLYGNDVPIYKAGYPGGFYSEDLKRWCKLPVKHKKLRILLGHSAYHFLQHKYYLSKFVKYKENLEFYIPLSYGNKKYAEEVQQLAEKNYSKENLKIFKDILNFEDYFKMLCDIDIAIFDYKHQAAVGNIMLLLYLQKHVFLNPNGILYRGFKTAGIDVFSTLDLEKADFSKLTNSLIDEHNKQYVERAISYSSFVKNWSLLFNDLIKMKKEI